MSQSKLVFKNGSEEDIVIAQKQAMEQGYQKALDKLCGKGIKWFLKNFLRLRRKPDFHSVANLIRWTTYGVYINHAEKVDGDWFDKYGIKIGNKIYLPAMPNLAVNSGLHISAQRTFVTTAGAILTPVSSSTNDGVRYGGVDNSATAVSATTDQFDTTGSNRFITLFDSNPIYATSTKIMTALFTIENTDTTIVHRRYGLGNDSANGSNTLFSMLSGFILDFNSRPYSITLESETTWTGS